MGRVLLVMGHRNTDPDDTQHTPAERKRTRLVVDHAAEALAAAGHTVRVLQREDGDNDPGTTTIGNRHFVARRCNDLIHQHDIQVMIDCHFQSSPNPNSGCFCIFPDGPGDTKAMNPLDVSVASTLARAVSDLTGIRQLHLGEPGGLGIMSEQQTGVGGQGHRLAMFHATKSTRERCARLVMENGDVQADLATIDSPGFYALLARAYVRTINQHFPVNGGGGGGGGGSPFHPFQPARLFHTHPGALGRKFATTSAPVLQRFERGEAIFCDGFFEAEPVAGDIRWLRTTGDPQLRIHSSGVVESL